MSCYRFSPGEVLTLERLKGPICPIVGLGEAADAFFSPKARLAWRKFRVTPGEEIRYVNRLRKRPGVLFADLNYLGTTASSEISEPLPLHLRGTWVVASEASSTPFNRKPMHSGAGVIIGPDVAPKDRTVVAAIEMGPSAHCDEVILEIGEGFRQATGEDWKSKLLVIATEWESKVVCADLWGAASHLGALAEVPCPITVINFSFDLGLICERESLDTGLPGNYAASFPLFEASLRAVLVVQRTRFKNAPILIAAAGNRRSTIQRAWRLAYPAVLPGVVAATQTASTQRQQDSLAESSDLPALGAGNICAGIPLATRRGSSFSSAWLSGAVAGRHPAEAGEKGRFAQVAQLFSDLVPKEIRQHGCSGVWLPPRIIFPCDSLLRPPVGSVKERSSLATPFEELLRSLNAHFPEREFLLAGGATLVSGWLRANEVTQEEWVEHLRGRLSSLLDDIDLAYDGKPFRGDWRTNVISHVAIWCSSELGEAPDWPERIEMRPLDEWETRIRLLQTWVPALSGVQTAEGALNPWGADDGLRTGNLSVLFPPPKIWNLNPQYLAGSNGTGYGILLWLSAILRTRALFFHLPRGQNLVHSKDNLVLIKAELARKRQELDQRTQNPDESLFGRLQTGSVDRFTRRRKRIQTHLDYLLSSGDELAEAVRDLVKEIDLRWEQSSKEDHSFPKVGI